MKTLILILLSGLSFAQMDFAAEVSLRSTGGGNGGDAVVCGEEVYMLDYVEAFGATDQFELTGSVAELVEGMILQTEGVDFYLYNKLKAGSQRLLDSIEEYEATGNPLTESVHFVDGKISDTDDEGHYVIPRNCEAFNLSIARLWTQ